MKDKKMTSEQQTRQFMEEGERYLKNYQYSKAEEAFKKAAELSPHNVWALNNWGNSLKNLNKYEEAIEKFKIATKLDPNYVGAWNSWGETLAIQNKYEEAIEKYKIAIEHDPNDAWAWSNWGNILKNQNKYEEAIEKFKITTEIDPNNVWAWNSWGNSLANLNQYEEAIEKYKITTEIDPNNVWAWKNWGIALESQGKTEEANEKHRKASELAPENSDYLVNLTEDKKGDNIKKVVNEGVVIGSKADAEIIKGKNIKLTAEPASFNLTTYPPEITITPSHSSLPGIWIAVANLDTNPDGVEKLITESQLEWEVNKGVRKGDIILMWETSPKNEVTYLFRAGEDAKLSFRTNNGEIGLVKLVEKYTLTFPLKWEMIQNNSNLSNWKFVQNPQNARRQENIRTQGVWPHLRQALIDTDESVEAVLDLWETNDPLPPNSPGPIPIPEDPSDAVPIHLDGASEKDHLGRRPFAQALSRHLKRIWEDKKPLENGVNNSNSDKAFIFHLHGPWGSGKSSLLNFLKQDLEGDNKKDDWIVIDFNAWQHQHLDHPWWFLMESVYQQSYKKVLKNKFWGAKIQKEFCLAWFRSHIPLTRSQLIIFSILIIPIVIIFFSAPDVYKNIAAVFGVIITFLTFSKTIIHFFFLGHPRQRKV